MHLLLQNGRVYKIKVTKPDGTVFAGGTVNVGIDEYLDGQLGNEPRAAFLRAEAPTQFTPIELKQSVLLMELSHVAEQATVVLDANGEAEFRLASTHDNDSARPVVWIDQNYDNDAGNNTLEAGEPVSVRANVSSNQLPTSPC